MALIEYDHKIGDRVTIKAIDMIGSVDALCTDINGEQYRVVYWNDGRRCSEWMYVCEIQRA